MSVKTGRFVIRRNGVVVDAEGSWSLGPPTNSAGIAGAEASLTWHQPSPVTALDRDYTQDDFDDEPVTIDWVDDEGAVRVYTGWVDSTSGESLADPSSRLTDGTLRLTRSLDLRPTAWTLPVHPELAGAGGRVRHVGLFGTWFTHQAMTTAGFDPGVPMYWSSVWYQSMCGSIATVPDKDRAFGSLGDLRQARRNSDPDLAPVFPQGDTQIVAADVFAFGTTTPAKGDTASLGWQVTVDMGKREVDPTYGSAGEVLLRPAPGTGLPTGNGVALEWDATNVRVVRHTGASTTTLGTYPRATGGIRDSRYSLAWLTSGAIKVRAGRWNAAGVWESRDVATIGASSVSLPTGNGSLCTVRVTSPGVIGPVCVSRSDRVYMTSDMPQGRIYRHSLTALSMPGFPWLPKTEAGSILDNQARAQIGMRGLPLLQWIDHDGVLVNADFESLAAGTVRHSFDTRPGDDALALDRLAWATNPGTAYSAVEVDHTGVSVTLRDTPVLTLASGGKETVKNGETYEVFLHPEQDTFWLEPDLRPLMAGMAYPTPPYPALYKNGINRRYKSIVGGYRVNEESVGDERPRGWIWPHQMGWRVDANGHVTGAMEMLDPDTVLISGTAVMPQGPPVQVGVTEILPTSPSVWSTRRDDPLPALRGSGIGRLHRKSVTTDIAGPDSRHGPYRHDCGLWVQSRTGAARVASNLHDAIVNPTPIRTATVEATGRVRVGDKVELTERRPDGIVIVEEVVALRVSGATSSSDDSMSIEGVVTARRVTQTDPSAPPVDEDEEWDTPPPDVDPEDPPSTVPPPWESDPPEEVDPATPPPTPSAGTLVYTALGGFSYAWDGALAGGGSAVDSDYATTEVALDVSDTTPETVRGEMWTAATGFAFVYAPAPGELTAGQEYYARHRTVDRWGNVSAWSVTAGPVEVVPLVDYSDVQDLVEQVVTEETALLDGKHTISPDAPTLADGDGKPLGAWWTQFDGDRVVGTWVLADNPLAPGGDPVWSERDPALVAIDQGTFGDLHGARLVSKTVLAEQLAVGDFENHLDNPATDLGVGGWSTDPVAVTGHPTGGTGALQVINAASHQIGGTNRWVPTYGGEQWHIAAQVRRTTTGAGAGGIYVGIETRDASGNPTGTFGAAYIDRTALTNGTWVEISGTAASPATAVEARLIWWTNNTYTSGTAQATALQLRKRLGAIRIGDGSILSPHIAGEQVEAQHLTAAMALVSRLISPATPGLTTGPRTEMNPSGIQVYRSAEGDEDYVLTNLSSSGAQTIGVMNPAGEAVAGITEDGEVSGVAGGFQSVKVGGTDLLGTLPLAPDDITWDPVDETAGTPLGWLDLVPQSSPGSVEFPSSTAFFTPADGEQYWFEFSGGFAAGRSYLIMADFRLGIGSGQSCEVRMRKTQVPLPSATGPTPPTTSSPTFGDIRTYLNGSSSSVANYGTFWTFNPTNSEEARFLVTLRNTGSTGEIYGSSARIAFVEVGHRSTQALNAIDRRVATVPTPPASGAKKTYTSRWYATEVVNYQGAVVSPPDGGSATGLTRAGQGRVDGMGTARRSYLRFDNATAHAGESGRTLSQALNGATIKSRRVRITNMRSTRSSVQAVIGRATSAGGTITSLATSSAIPRGDQRTTSLGNGLTQAQMRAAGFRLVIGPGSSTADVSYAEFAGTGDGSSRRVELTVTYER